MDIGQWIVIGLSAFFLLWILIGSSANHKRADQVLSWVQNGTKQLGRISGARKIKGSAVQLTIKDAAAPFRQVNMIFAMEPRENPPLWIYNRLQGKQDELVIQANLRTAPKQQLAFTQGQGVEQTGNEGLHRFLAKYAGAIQRISIERTTPHLSVHTRLAPVLAVSLQDFIEDLKDLILAEGEAER
jgi:hypothetical protein